MICALLAMMNSLFIGRMHLGVLGTETLRETTPLQR